MPGVPEWIGKPDPPVVVADQGSGLKGVQVEGMIIKLPLGLGVVGLQNLKSAVQEKSLDLIGPQAASDVVFSLDNNGIQSIGPQKPRATEPRRPGPDHTHISHAPLREFSRPCLPLHPAYHQGSSPALCTMER
jgi:hypothetical protein